MQKKTISILAISLILIGAVTLLIGIHKKVHLVINGEKETQTTFAITVGGFLRQEDILLNDKDRLSPSPQRILRGNDTIFIQRSIPISIAADGNTTQVITSRRKPANILAELDIPLYPGDQILIDGQPADPEKDLDYQPQYTIHIRRSTPLTIQNGSQRMEISSHAQTLAQALWEADIDIYEGDQLTPGAQTPLTGKPLQVEIKRAQPVKIILPDRTLTSRTTADTVGAALSGAGVSLQGRDYAKPDENGPIPESGKIEIIRVKEEIILEQEPIPFTSTYQPIDDLELDQRTIVEGGEYGLKASRVRVVYENGEEVGRITEKEWTAKEPQPRVIGYGTDIVVRTENTRDGEIRYWRKITAYATSYDETCPGCNNTTYSGTRLEKGTIAVTREWYQYMQGLRVYIPGYGFGRIEDIGAGVAGEYWVDLGYRSENYVPWNRNVSVYFLAPPPTPQNIMYILY